MKADRPAVVIAGQSQHTAIQACNHRSPGGAALRSSALRRPLDGSVECFPNGENKVPPSVRSVVAVANAYRALGPQTRQDLQDLQDLQTRLA